MSEGGPVIGLDVGSQGARVLVVEPDGTVLGEAARTWTVHQGTDGRHEQDPRHWLVAAHDALSDALAAVPRPRRRQIGALAVTSTSGTLVLTDAAGEPLRPAIMWSDTRAGAQASALTHTMRDFTSRTGLRIRGSFPLAKLAWLREHEPATLARAAHVCHASDWLLWHLGLGRAVTDPTNALKSGYDPQRRSWDPVVDEWGLTGRLPEVVDSGTPLGTLSPALARDLDLPGGIVLVGAMTDANTAMLAAGVVAPGQWMTTLGTGLSIKGVQRTRLDDPTGSVYCHLDPRGQWLPSGTSHCGAAEVSARFGADLDALTSAAAAERPGQMIVYPLPGRGDYFPRWDPDASAFRIGTAGRAGEFRSTLEGIAVVEALAYRRLAELGANISDTVVAVGGASRSTLWNSIRATVQGRALRTVVRPDTAVGAAASAFAGLGTDVTEVVRRMVRPGPTVEPDPHLRATYQDLVGQYEEQFELRGGQRCQEQAGPRAIG